MTSRVEYIWLDAEGEIREKSRFLTLPMNHMIYHIPNWSFNGSSTGQAPVTKSDLILMPTHMFDYPNPAPFRTHNIVICEVLNSDGSAHSTNHRRDCINIMKRAMDHEPMFGIEQEYVLTHINLSDEIAPYQWNSSEGPYVSNSLGSDPVPVKQGPFYCGVGGTRAFGRAIVEEHIQTCIKLGVTICGAHAETMASQWEYQIGPLSGDRIGDHLIVSRYLLQRIAEKHGADVSFHPKPAVGWNGSGGHTNFSTKAMRENISAIYEGCAKLAAKHTDHMAIYGKQNDQRLCAAYETSDPSIFTYGVGDRSCSVRIPQQVFQDKKGYLEDRRPAANMDPYLVCGKIVETICF